LDQLLPIAKLDDNSAGTPCKENTDCKGTEAYCGLNGACTGLCDTNDDCGKGGTCITPLGGLTGICGKVCKADSECGKGLDCRAGIDFDDLTAMAADAGFSAIDAGVDLHNVPMTCGVSLGVVQLGDGVVGTACTSDTTCAPGECAANINIFESFPGGYCTGKCLVDKDCGASGVCYKDPFTSALGAEGRCLLGCSTNASCRSGQVCRVSAIIDSKSYCLPPVMGAGANDAGVTTDN
jgi:hypothetical protein